ncbi:MAG: nucleoside recognition domain-containing protein [Bacillota bacterium]|jgi:spore maturation protein SpmB
MYPAVLKRGLSNGFSISLELAKAIIPVYILIKVLDVSGILPVIAQICTPLMNLMGLPGEASLLLVLGNCLNIYSILGGIQALDLTAKQINILAIMVLISHSLFMESAVLNRTGTNAFLLTCFRFLLSIICGMVINLLW